MNADRVAQFEADIAAGPAALERLLDGWRAPDLGGRARYVFTGLGSSRFAALVVAAALQARGTAAWVEHASSGAPAAPAHDEVLVAISASGRTREVIGAAEAHRGRSLVVAVTNTADSPLAHVADVVVPLEAGEEASGIACRTFRATVVALAMLTGVAGRDDLRLAVDAVEAHIDARETWLPPLADALDGAPAIDVLADASLLGLAEQAALLLREAPRLPAHAWDTGDWLHTGVYLALPRHRALLYPGAAADDEVIATIRRRGGEVAIVPQAAAHLQAGLVARTVVDSTVGELLAAALWRRTHASDKEP
jgi:glucosamine--fructose-6-phosphate aminotransferase (isomerizing)